LHLHLPLLVFRRHPDPELAEGEGPPHSDGAKGTPMPDHACVYILASSFKHLYIGFTTNLEQRIRQHKNHTFPDSFTARYRIDQLVYFERYSLITRGIAREKELKGWLRNKKIALIIANNPDWKDLSAEWGQPIEPWSELSKSPLPK
jgi:putative endonuclease